MPNLNKKVKSLEKQVHEIANRTPPQKEILTAKETMELLDISRNTFDRLRKNGKLKCYKLQRKIFCRYSEILEALEGGLLEAA